MRHIVSGLPNDRTSLEQGYLLSPVYDDLRLVLR